MDPVDGGAGWESWSSEVVALEAASFDSQAQSLIGRSDEQLKHQLGVPDEDLSGTRWESAEGELLLQADRDLRYFGLLPHVVVSFAIAAGCVARVLYSPKWRRCPANFVSDLRRAYAPE
jgi:hypothetical protein